MPTLPVPLGIKVRFSFNPVVISKPILDRVNVPVYVVAPEVKVDNTVLPTTFNDDRRFVPEVTVKDDPSPTLPAALRVVREVRPRTSKEDCRLAPETTLKD